MAQKEDGNGLARIGTGYFQCTGRTGCAQPGACLFSCQAYIYADDIAHVVLSWTGAHGNMEVQGDHSWMKQLSIHAQARHYIMCLRLGSRATPSAIYKLVYFFLICFFLF